MGRVRGDLTRGLIQPIGMGVGVIEREVARSAARPFKLSMRACCLSGTITPAGAREGRGYERRSTAK